MSSWQAEVRSHQTASFFTLQERELLWYDITKSDADAEADADEDAGAGADAVK